VRAQAKGQDPWHAQLTELLELLWGVHSVARDTCHPAADGDNRYAGSNTLSRPSSKWFLT
jgi:hypothetical protein